MICPKCNKGDVVFQDVVDFDPETIELEFFCLGCNRKFLVDIDEYDLKEVKERE